MRFLSRQLLFWIVKHIGYSNIIIIYLYPSALQEKKLTFSLSRKNLAAPKINIHMHTQEDEKQRRLRQYTQRHDAFRLIKFCSILLG